MKKMNTNLNGTVVRGGRGLTVRSCAYNLFKGQEVLIGMKRLKLSTIDGITVDYQGPKGEAWGYGCGDKKFNVFTACKAHIQSRMKPTPPVC